MGLLSQFVDFIVERPALAGAVVYGTFYMIRQARRRSSLSAVDTAHALEVHESERTYADKMYDPLKPEEEGVSKPVRKYAVK